MKRFDWSGGMRSDAGIRGWDIHEGKQEGDTFLASASVDSIFDVESKASVDTGPLL
jgi:hypothetical protein